MSRESIIGKVLLEGRMELCSPLLIGSGGQRAESDVDTQILLDKEGRPFIPGTSIAGVLRAATETDKESVLFGGKIASLGGAEVQSAVNIGDVELHDAQIILRDGVCIDDTRGVAVDERKYDYELVECGAQGDFRAEITLRGYHEEILGDELPTVILELAEGVAAGFRLGAMTAKGFGRVRVNGLAVDYYDFKNRADAIAWLSIPRGTATRHYDITEGTALTDANLIVDAKFALVGSLIVKDTDVPTEKRQGESRVHAVMKKSRNDYLIPGPSVKGALRHHAGRILSRLGFKDNRAVLNKLMGMDDEALKEARKKKDKETVRQSRFLVDEIYIAPRKGDTFDQTRNRIDRFTGGTIKGALFTTEAVWGKEDIPIHFEIHDAEDYETGLALLLLKDLSLGRLPLGGEKSIGRGVLKGTSATIRYRRKEEKEPQIFVIKNGSLIEGNPETLENCVAALSKKAEVEA